VVVCRSFEIGYLQRATEVVAAISFILDEKCVVT
jgi:hypothetical protein